MREIRRAILTVCVGVLLGALATPVLASDGEPGGTTGPFLNGRGWGYLSKANQIVYVSALMSGLHFAAVILEDSSSHQLYEELYLPRASAGEIAKGIEQIYSDEANVNVPVVYILQAFAMRLGGRSENDITKHLEESRKLAYKMMDLDRKKAQ